MTYQSPEALRDIHALVVDMDGVLWRGDVPLPGLTDFFDLLRGRSISFRLATNNASKTPGQYVGKLASMGVAVKPDYILTSAVATAQYLAAIAPGASVYVIGGDGLRQAVLDYGLRLSSGGYADFVAVGWYPGLTYSQLSEATLLIRAGAKFIGCNPDRTLPGERGLLPGNGATLAFLQASTDVAPLIIGKPERMMFDVALKAMGADPAHTAMLGDRLETDIAGGQRAGLRTILVLSGASDEAALAASPVKPDWVFDSIQELAHAWDDLPKDMEQVTL
jgi:4-nitrophenyl phosphatase